MTARTDMSAQIRTYGGWRRSRGIGLFGLGAGATVMVLASAVVPLAVAGFSLRWGLLLCLPAAVLVGLILVRWDGTSVGHVVQRRMRWWWGSLRGYSTFRTEVAADHPLAWQLPGALAQTRLTSADDGRGGRFGVVWDQRSGFLTSTLQCAASSTWLVDGPEADSWVSNWHGWLASLGYMPLVRWTAVTVDTAPEPGTTLRDNVLGRLDPDAPADAQLLLRELVARSPAAAADVDTRVSVTFDPTQGPEGAGDLDSQTAEVSRALVGLESALAACGVSVLGRATQSDLVGVVRTAYDPASRGEVERLLASSTDNLLTWADAGPVAAEEVWDHYRHDSGVSVTWAWHEAPRQQVTSDVLTRLMSPGKFPKRVTVLYRPLSAGTAARILEDQVNAASFRDAYRRAQGRDATARDQADREQAIRAAREEALGAGVVLMSLYVTVTVPDPAELPAAVADVEARADQSKIRLRRMYGAQAAGFATTLPTGVCPTHLATRGSR